MQVSFRAMLTRKDQPKKDKKAARPKRAAKPRKAAAAAAEELADLGGDAESDDDFGGGTSDEVLRQLEAEDFDITDAFRQLESTVVVAVQHTNVLL